MSDRVRVLVVDDSAFARKVIRETLAADRRLDVVDIARDGLEAVEKIQQLAPDVVTLDLVMPNLDGLGVLTSLEAMRAPPAVVVVSISGQDTALGVEALQRGAFDVVQKPTAMATARLYDMGSDLIAKVVAAGAARNKKNAAPAAVGSPPPRSWAPPRRSGGIELVVIGASTGGPQALTRLLIGLPASFPAPIAIALHIPEGYTRSMAQRLDGASELSITEAADETRLAPGHVVIARGGSHLAIERSVAGDVIGRTISAIPDALYAPSVDHLFTTAAAALGDRVLAVVLTGMGSDGLEGAKTLRARGAQVVTESEASCVVYGMPRAVREAGLSTCESDLDDLATVLGTLVR